MSRKNQLKTAFEPDTCFQCHKDRRAQMFRSSHMPLREGKIVCSDCHNPHGSVTEALLQERFDQRQLLQVPCREARAVPVRTCAGARELRQLSRSARLDERVLAEVSRPRLCFECHNLMDVGDAGLHNVEGGLGRACQNCHVANTWQQRPGGDAFGR